MDKSERKGPCYQTVEGVVISAAFDENAFRSCLSYTPKKGDLFIATFPKCGTTWMQMIVFLICNKGKPAEDVYEFLKKMPFLDMTGVDCLENGEKPCAFKTHLPFSRTPYSKEAKYIYVARNPKDVVVSYYHHVRSAAYIYQEGDFHTLCELFMDGQVEYGNIFDHFLGWYEHCSDSNVLYITFEELKRDPRGTILRVAGFMGREYLDMLEQEPGIMENVLKYSSADEMKKLMNNYAGIVEKNASLTMEDIDALPIALGIKHFRKFALQHRTTLTSRQFIRQGKVGGWKELLTDEQESRIDNEIKERLSGTFMYETWKKTAPLSNDEH